MSFSRVHKWIAYLMAGLGLGALGLGNELSPVVQFAFAGGYILSMFAEGRIVHSTRYALAWNLAVVLLLLLQLTRATLFEPTLAMALEFAGFLQISRLFNRRGASDYQQIAVLALLHLIAATALSAELVYAALFLGFVVVTPWMLALSHLRREVEERYMRNQVPEAASNAAPLHRVLSSRRIVGPGFLVGTALLAVPLFLLTSLVFVAIPRVGKGFFSFERGLARPVAGFGSEVALGRFGIVRDDPTVVLRVMPLAGIDERAQRLTLRMRGTSFDHYDGRRWTRTPSVPTPVRRAADYYAVERWPEPQRDRYLRVILDRLDEPVVFLPEGTVGIAVPPRLVDGVERPRHIVRGAGRDVRYLDADGTGLVYVAHVDSRATDDPPPLTASVREIYLQLPSGHERVFAEARALTRGLQTDADKADALERFLRDSGELEYTLDQPHVGERAPLEVFLLEAKRGHCEYFSTAMTIMLRALDIPARNATGFLGGRYNPYGGYYALRQGDAHSWVEAYIEGRGWVTYDPTPVTHALLGPGEGPLTTLQAMLDALRTRWSTAVIGYDLRTQFDLLRRTTDWLSGLSAPRAPSDPSSATEPSRESGVGTWLAWAALALVVSFAILWAARRLEPLPRRGRDSLRDAHAARQVYAALERTMKRRGLERPPHHTPLEHAKHLAELRVPAHQAISTLTEGYMACRYGGQALGAEELRRLQSLLAEVKAALPPPDSIQKNSG